MNKIKISLISLGCEKNLVDSENILAVFNPDEFVITNNLDESNLIIINTCGFITAAKKEAIDTIYDTEKYKIINNTKIVVCGCLVQRYKNELQAGMNFVDLWVTIKDYPNLNNLFKSLFSTNYNAFDRFERVISTPKHLCYIKISEGCNNNCTYCAIPLIRGSFRSFEFNKIVQEFKKLVSQNYYEICLISQDTTSYGKDINTNLIDLLKELVLIVGNYKIRLMYLYPNDITKELIDFIKDNPKIYPYFDMPLQHGSDKMLKWMNRRGNITCIKEIINYIRSAIPEAIIRTTIIVGFPHETEKDFEVLKKFVSDVSFDRLGIFCYSKEEGTKGFSMNSQVSENTKQKRKDELLEIQKYISLNRNLNRVNTKFSCIIEGHDGLYYYGRSYAFAPLGIDGYCLIKTDKVLEIGTVVNVYVTEACFYDLICELCDE